MWIERYCNYVGTRWSCTKTTFGEFHHHKIMYSRIQKSNETIYVKRVPAVDLLIHLGHGTFLYTWSKGLRLRSQGMLGRGFSYPPSVIRAMPLSYLEGRATALESRPRFPH